MKVKSAIFTQNFQVSHLCVKTWKRNIRYKIYLVWFIMFNKLSLTYFYLLSCVSKNHEWVERHEWTCVLRKPNITISGKKRSLTLYILTSLKFFQHMLNDEFFRNEQDAHEWTAPGSADSRKHVLVRRRCRCAPKKVKGERTRLASLASESSSRSPPGIHSCFYAWDRLTPRYGIPCEIGAMGNLDREWDIFSNSRAGYQG